MWVSTESFQVKFYFVTGTIWLLLLMKLKSNLQWIPDLRFAQGTSILYLKSRKTLNGGYIKMKQKITPLVIMTLAKRRTCIWLKFTRGSLQWAYMHNLSTPQSAHKRMPHQAMWLDQAVVAGEEVTLVISKGGKDFTYFLRLQTHWW
jgi:hypothetical protein